ncbi:hypothetical protein EDC56_1031 [Sinobacterium caligoides]|uniref:Methyltransferase family protein n=1 Tax=Sinobacterium caligoides TaxID=933926 RepID=A0A3N2E068_9GAMM|nr:class I SAM-dependent methyltransferase [Sinobacterium caligoides]ROS05501.1 hypothetical protein EDC56_1031 [Sinobacterium caligoides]
MSTVSYHKSDIDAILKSRDRKQLAKQFSIIDELYPDGVFTHLEFGCACGSLFTEWLQRYPKAKFIGVDLDIEDQYGDDWAPLVRDYPNLLTIAKVNMLDKATVISLLQDNFGVASVNVIHGHAAIMYLSDEKTAQFLCDASTYSQYIISRDMEASNFRFGGDENCIKPIRLLEKCTKDIDSVWSESIGRYVRPMTRYEVRNSSFSFQQFADHEVYTPDSEPSLMDAVFSHGQSASNLLWSSDEQGHTTLHPDYNEDMLDELKNSLLYFAEHGDYMVSCWVVSFLENKKVIAR